MEPKQRKSTNAAKPLAHFWSANVWSANAAPMYLVLALIIAGCAPASVNPGTVAAPVSTRRPDQIVVYDFAVDSAEVTENQSIFQRAYRAVSMNADQQKSELKVAHQAAKVLSDSMARKFKDLGFNVEHLPRGTPAPDGAVVVDGQFVNVDEGNRLRRLVIGFGAGASKLDTQVNISQASNGVPRQLLDFTTHAESSKMPGAAFTMGAGAAAQGGATVGMAAAGAGIAGVKTHRSTVDFLADSTAKQIVAYFSQYASAQGWITQGQAPKASLDQKQ
jgi:hypothetical protein